MYFTYGLNFDIIKTDIISILMTIKIMLALLNGELRMTQA